jgi:uncharacterized alkaline shock family protein YloU
MNSILPDQPASTPPAPAGATTPVPTPLSAPDVTGDGVTAIEDSVIGTVAALAVREVPGVHSLGSASARAIGVIRESLGSEDSSRGITVVIEDRAVTVDVVLVADYPVPLHALAESVRTSVTQAIEGLVGLSVTAVNVTITDIYADEERDDNGVVTSSSG